MVIIGLNEDGIDTSLQWSNDNEFTLLVKHQLFHFFCYAEDISRHMREALERAEKCFRGIESHYYYDKELQLVQFSPFRSNQYALFLYYLANTAYHNGDIRTAEKVYYLNKSLNGVEWFYEVELPEVIYADHPIGCVLGRAKYGNHFMTSQGCTIGNNHDIYPSLSDYVMMHPYSMIIGNSNIGSFVEISAYSFIRDQDIPNDCLVFGKSPNLKIINRPHAEMVERFNIFKDRR